MLAIAIVAGFVSRLLLTTQFRVKLRQLTRNEEGHISEDESININEISSQVNRLVHVYRIDGDDRRGLANLVNGFSNNFLPRQHRVLEVGSSRLR